MGVALLLIQISANNWRSYGSIFGHNEIVHLMLSHDVVMLGLTDGVMCISTVFCLFLQKIIAHGYLSWNRSGWILQNVCSQIFSPLKCHIADFLSRSGSFFSWLLILHFLDIEIGHGHIQFSLRCTVLRCS
jgi:hypothetical protein